MTLNFTPSHDEPLSLTQAQEAISSCVENFLSVQMSPTQTVALEHAFGRVLAQEIISPIHVPAYTNSAMDGFAFQMPKALAPRGEVQRFKIVGVSFAGQPFTGTIGPQECIKIMTGAMVPNTLDTVAPLEAVETSKPASDGLSTGQASIGDFIDIDTSRFHLGANRRLRGEDIAKGDCVLPRGHRLHAASMGLIASLGFAQVQVKAKLRVAVFSTGNELLKPGEDLKESMIYDSNRFSLMGLLKRLDCEVLDWGIVPDQATALEHTLREAAQTCDVIITSGGVSDGDADFTHALMKKMGDVRFCKIAIRPGRPLAFGTLGKSLFFALPGNPVAVMVTFLSLVRPALFELMGLSDEHALENSSLRAQCEVDMSKNQDAPNFKEALCKSTPGENYG